MGSFFNISDAALARVSQRPNTSNLFLDAYHKSRALSQKRREAKAIEKLEKQKLKLREDIAKKEAEQKEARQALDEEIAKNQNKIDEEKNRIAREKLIDADEDRKISQQQADSNTAISQAQLGNMELNREKFKDAQSAREKLLNNMDSFFGSGGVDEQPLSPIESRQEEYVSEKTNTASPSKQRSNITKMKEVATKARMHPSTKEAGDALWAMATDTDESMQKEAQQWQEGFNFLAEQYHAVGKDVPDKFLQAWMNDVASKQHPVLANWLKNTPIAEMKSLLETTAVDHDFKHIFTAEIDGVETYVAVSDRSDKVVPLDAEVPVGKRAKTDIEKTQDKVIQTFRTHTPSEWWGAEGRVNMQIAFDNGTFFPTLSKAAAHSEAAQALLATLGGLGSPQSAPRVQGMFDALVTFFETGKIVVKEPIPEDEVDTILGQ